MNLSPHIVISYSFSLIINNYINMKQISFSMDDNFDKNYPMLKKTNLAKRMLETVKKEFLEFYNSKTEPHGLSVFAIYEKITNYSIQIMRLRQIIQPKPQFTINQHQRTKIIYIIVKGFWVNDKGVSKRDAYKSFAREDDYPQGRKDPQIYIDGLNVLQEELIRKYNS